MSDDPPEDVVNLQSSGEVDWLAAGREEQDADSDGETTDAGGAPDTDPRHLDPAGDLADLVESGELELSLTGDADREQLRAFIEAIETSDGPVDPGDEAIIRIARELLSDDGD